MRATGPMHRTAVAVTLVTVAVMAAGCTGTPPVIDKANPSGAPTTPTDPQGRLAALAATAQDHRFVATYTLVSPGRAARTLLVAIANDGTWRVDVPGGGLSGAADLAMVGGPTGTYQCVVGGSATRAPTPDPSASASAAAGRPYAAPGCVKVGATNRDIPKRYDPVFEHLFTDWLGVLTDRDAPIDVGVSTAGPRVAGACFSVQPSSASLAPAMSAGVYCFTPDGTLTGAKIPAGTITIDHDPAPAPPTMTLPGPVGTGPATPVKAPAGGV